MDLTAYEENEKPPEKRAWRTRKKRKLRRMILVITFILALLIPCALVFVFSPAGWIGSVWGGEGGDMDYEEITVIADPDYDYVGAPLNFTVIDNGGNTATLLWGLGIDAANTTIVVKRESAPVNMSDGEVIYTSNGTEYLHEGLALETTKYYYELWSWNASKGYSTYTASGSVGGEAMESLADSLTGLSTNIELIASVIFNLTFLLIALWRRELFLYIITGPVAMAFGFYWAQTYLIAGISFAVLGGYCWFLAALTWMRNRHGY